MVYHSDLQALAGPSGITFIPTGHGTRVVRSPYSAACSPPVRTLLVLFPTQTGPQIKVGTASAQACRSRAGPKSSGDFLPLSPRMLSSLLRRRLCRDETSPTQTDVGSWRLAAGMKHPSETALLSSPRSAWLLLHRFRTDSYFASNSPASVFKAVCCRGIPAREKSEPKHAAYTIHNTSHGVYGGTRLPPALDVASFYLAAYAYRSSSSIKDQLTAGG